jgi:hypothetical protein
MRLNDVLTRGRKATEAGFSGAGATVQWIENLSELHVALAILLESGPEKLQITEAFAISQGYSPVHQCGKHSPFVGRVVVEVGMEIEIHKCVVLQ